MKNRRNSSSLLLQISIVLTILYGTTATYEGCYRVSRPQRWFATSPGSYNPDNLNTDTCVARCADWGYDYAGATAARFCFCAQNLPDVSKKEVDDTKCNEACSNPANGDMCGSKTHVSVYKTPKRIKGLVVRPTGLGIIEIGSQLQVEVSTEAGPDDIQYSMDYGDGAGATDVNVTGLFTKTYAMPGEYTVTVEATDVPGAVPAKQASVEVLVQAPVTQVSLQCPHVVATHEEFRCNASVRSGSFLNAEVTYDDGTVDSFPIADAKWHGAGPGIPGHAGSAVLVGSATDSFYIMPNSEFGKQGYLTAYEYYATSTGTVNFLVLAPYCASNSYCYNTNGCPATCDSYLHVDCTGSVFCGFQSTCSNTALTTCDARPDRYASSATAAYTVKSVISHTISATGYGILQVNPSTEVLVSPGDVIGYTSDATANLATRSLEVGEAEDQKHNSVNTVVEGNQPAVDYTGTGSRHLLKAHATRPTWLLSYHSFSDPGNRTVMVNVSNEFITGWQVDSVIVPVQEGINAVEFEHLDCVATDDTATFTLLPHTGAEIIYDWGFGDGSASVQTSSPRSTHSYTTAGQYNVSVYAHNLLSSKENMTTVCIQDAVTGVQLSTEPAAAGGAAAVISLNITSGTDYVCDWQFGDGGTLQTDALSSPLMSGSSQSHPYATAGTYSVAISCYNQVSRENATRDQVVLDPIVGVALTTKSALTGASFTLVFEYVSGSDPVFTLSLGGTDVGFTRTGALEYTSDPQSGLAVGLYNVVIDGSNAVSSVSVTSNFTVEEAITGAVSEVEDDLTTVLSGDTVEFSVTLQGGSSVQVSWDYNDGTAPDTYYTGTLVAWPPGQKQTQPHRFQSGGVFEVEVTVSNNLDTFTATHSITVYQRVENLTLVTNSPVAFLEGSAEVSFQFYTTSEPPADAVAYVDFGDGTVIGPVAFDLTTVRTHTYYREGTYTVKANITNAINSMILYETVSVIEPVTDMEIYVDPRHAPIGADVVVGVSMTTGSGVELSFDFGDSSAPVVKPRTATNPYQKDEATHIFTVVGTYDMEIVATNLLGSTSMTYRILAQQPVTSDFQLTSTAPLIFPPGDVSVTVTLPAGSVMPTDAQVLLVWGDGTQTGPVSLASLFTTVPGTYTFDHTYLEAGDYQPKVVIYNEATSLEFPVEGGVYREIVNVRATPKYQPLIPYGGADVSGFGPNKDHFPLSREVKFHFAMDKGTVVLYQVEAVHDAGAAVQFCNSSVNPAPMQFTLPGTYHVKVIAWNPVSHDDFQLDVTMVKAVVGIRIEYASNGGNKDRTFIIRFDEIGTDTCVTVDYGDGDVEVYGDDSAACMTQTGATVIAGPGPDTGSKSLTVNHRFQLFRQYEVTVTGANYLSEDTATLTLTISNRACNAPSVDIIDKTPLFYLPRVVKRNERFSMIGQTQLDCAATLINKKSWQIFKVDPTTGAAMKTIDMNSSPELKETYNNTELSVPPRFLAYGLYKFTFSVQMEDDITKHIFSNDVDAFVEVTASELVASFTSGGMTRITRGVGSEITLEPGEHSYDPDVDQSEDQEITSFNWFCRQLEEDWPVDANGELLATNPTTPLTLAQLNNEGIGDDQGGCFRRGPGAVDSHAGILSFRSENFHVNEMYLFAVEVIKGDRRAWAYIEVDVAASPPPIVEIDCPLSVCTRTSEGLMVNPTNRLALIGSCDNCPPDAEYTFTMFRKGLSGAYIEMTEDEFNAYVTGTSSSEIAISTQLFADGFELYPFLFEYMVRLKVEADGFSTIGTAYTKFAVNKAPTGGICTVSPSEGVIAETVFSINCPGWYDMDGIETYQYLALFEGDVVEKQISSSEFSSIDTELPLGPESADYNMTIVVRVYDSKGAFAEIVVGIVKVVPMSQQATSNIIKELLKDGQTALNTASAEENFDEAIRTYSWGVAVVNAASDYALDTYECVDIVPRSVATVYGATGESYTTPAHCSSLTKKQKTALLEQYEAERADLARLREEVVIGLTGMTTATPEAIGVFFSMSERVTEKTEELTRRSQETLASSCQSKLDDLLGMAKNGKLTKERTQSILTAAILAISRVEKGTNIGLEYGLATDIELASKSDKYFYDTYYNSQRKRFAGETRQEARKGLRHETNKLVQTDVAAAIIPKLSNTMNTVGEVARESLVAGEEMIFDTEENYFAVSKKRAKKITDRIVHLGGDCKVKMPPWCDINTKPSCTGEEVVTLQASSVPYNKYAYLGSGISSWSGIVSLEFYDEDNNKIDVTDTETDIVISIPRDDTLPTTEPTDVLNPVMPDDVHQFFHSFNITDPHASVHISLSPDDPSVQFFLYVEFGGFPDVMNQSYAAFGVVDASSSDIFLDSSIVNGHTGKVVLGLRQAEPEEVNRYNEDNPPPIPEPETGRITCDYTLKTYESACYFFDEKKSVVSSEGCEVAPGSNEKITHCSCNHLTGFGGGMTVQPNKIDFAFVFSNMDFYKNPTLYITQIVIVLFFLLALVWARRQDKKDIMKLGVTPLPDNLPKDRYLYEITVQTGMRRNAATDSKVHFILSGEYDETDVRVLEDPQRKVLRRGAVDTFLMATPRPLGPLNYARIWHDNSGKGQYASWYLRYMVLQDLQTKQKFNFIVNKWFAVEEDDGQVDRLVSVAGKEQMAEFGHLFSQSTRKNMGDEHIWFSVVARPPQSRFTRVQRVCCCLCLLYTSMLGNALFYEKADDTTGSDGLKIGPFSVTPQQIYVGVIVNLVVFPVNFLLVFLFRKSRPKNKRPSRIQEALTKLFSRSDNSANSSQSDVKQLLGASSLQLGASSSPTDMNRPLSGDVRPKTPPIIRQGQKAEAAKKKKKFNLPWWFKIVAWILLWMTVAVSAAFVTFYGVMFEDRKCKKWITSMVISFITSIFLTQPIKVFMVALLLSLVFKKVEEEDESEDDEEEPVIQHDEEWMYPPPGTDGYAAARPRTIAYRPPDPEVLETAREFRVKELKMYDVLREIVFYAFFLWLLMVISYGFRDPNSFTLRRGLKATFVDGGRPTKWSTGDNDFQKVADPGNYWNWAKDVMAPGLRADFWYNGQPPYGQRGFAGDRVGRLMGYATMRQLRIRPGLCDTTKKMKPFVPECNEKYKMEFEETGDYGVGWSPLEANTTANNSKVEYIYREAHTLNGYPYWGTHGLYSGGGYVVELTGSLKVIQAKMDELRSELWIDSYTRAVFVEFTLYNAQVNLFAIVTLLAEFIDTGGIEGYYRVEPVNLLGYYSGAMMFQIACEVTYVIFILVMIVKEIRNMYRQKKGYFKQVWNYLELMIISISIAAVAIYMYRFLKARSLIREFRDTHGNGYTKFQYVGYWNEVLLYLVGWLVFMATIKFIRLLRFNRRMSLLASTLRYGAKPFAMFGIIFFIVFFAYAQFFYMIYFCDLVNFSNIIFTMETCLQMLVGKFNFTAMKFASPLLGPIVFFFYVLTVYYILINMFLTILNESFAAVRRDVSKQSNEHELVEFVVKRFKQWTGLGALLGDGTKKKGDGQDVGSTIAPARPVFNSVDHFPETVDRLLDSITKVYFNQDNVDNIIRGGATDKASMKKLMHSNPVKQSMGRMESMKNGMGLSDVEDIQKELAYD